MFDTWCQNKWKEYKAAGAASTPQVMAQLPAWMDLRKEIEEKFTQPLEQQQAQIQLDLLRQNRMTASEFFNKFDLYSRAAGQNNDTYLIFLVRRALNTSIISAIASSGKIPTTYADWKEMAIAIDDSRRLLLSKDARPNFSSLSNLAKHAQQRKGVTHQPVREPSTSRDTQGTVFGGTGQPMELDRIKGS